MKRLILTAALIALIAMPAMAIFTVSGVNLSTTTLNAGQSFTLDFTYSSDQANRQ
jgi:hypothetical protein